MTEETAHTTHDIQFNQKDLLFDGYLEVESVRVGPDTGPQGDYQGVEVRAATTPDAPFWRSLRYHAPTARAPRARDMLHIIVLVCGTPPTAEQVVETVIFKTEERKMPPGPAPADRLARLPEQVPETLAERESES